MSLFKRFWLSVGFLVAVINVSLIGSHSAHARPEPIWKDNSSTTKTAQVDTASLDWSRIDWTALARFMYGRCGEYHDLAISVGWTEAQWPKLSYVMYRESRCNTQSFNRKDPNGGSRGLIQINGYWCKKNKYNPSGWLQAQGILSNCEELFDAKTNLRAGLAMWNYSQQRNRCGWRPWATRC